VIEVRKARGQPEIDAALDLRYEVFCLEQGVTLEDDRDGHDREALHLVALDAGTIVGTCRLLVEGTTVKLGRMAVAAAQRGLGIARRLLSASEPCARELGATRIVLAAQVTAQALYERAGYEPYGEVFLDAGIDHVMMVKPLS
jgi:predicted GNAT family N-acyltransferase